MIRTERIRTFDAEDKCLHEKRQALEQCETGLEMSLTLPPAYFCSITIQVIGCAIAGTPAGCVRYVSSASACCLPKRNRMGRLQFRAGENQSHYDGTALGSNGR